MVERDCCGGLCVSDATKQIDMREPSAPAPSELQGVLEQLASLSAVFGELKCKVVNDALTLKCRGL